MHSIAVTVLALLVEHHSPEKELRMRLCNVAVASASVVYVLPLLLYAITENYCTFQIIVR